VLRDAESEPPGGQF